MSTVFPTNPRHRMVFEPRPGLLFQYDATIRSWIKLAAAGAAIPLATPVEAGAMSAADLRKLNRLVIPAPASTITGTDCVAPYSSGNIGLFAGDEFLEVSGNVKVQNIDSKGDHISKDMPFKIHQNTYGFDFSVNLPALVNELKTRNQFKVVGKTGDKGPKGETGDPGLDSILSGPQGEQGDDGPSPPCTLGVEQDSLQVQPHEGMTKALVNARVVLDETDDSRYSIEFDRQTVGPGDFAADKLHVQTETSTWVLAVTGNQSTDGGDDVFCTQGLAAGQSQGLYYVDVDPLIDAIKQQFLVQVGNLKAGYESAVQFWVQTMSDLFDEQKQALCCALEHCLSIKKNAEVRQHIEGTAAAAAGSANILLHSRDSADAVSLSSTRTLKQIGGPDLCRGGPGFPQYPNLGASAAAATQAVDGTPAPMAEPVGRATVTIDPLLNVTPSTAVLVPLAAGEYVAEIGKAEVVIDGQHRANVKVQSMVGGVKKATQFLDKGSFASLVEAKEAYEGLTLPFHHDGGLVGFWLPSAGERNTSGLIELWVEPKAKITAPKPVPVKEEAKTTQPLKPQKLVGPVTSLCPMATNHLAWYERGWQEGSGCGCVINVMGQDFIVLRRSLGTDKSCGGGESNLEPCVAKFGSPAFAWPTFDGRKFVGVPVADVVTFELDQALSNLAVQKLVAGDVRDARGNLQGITTVLFPVG